MNQPTSSEQEQPPSKIRVYLVEDQTLVREMLRAMLEQETDIEVVGEAAQFDLFQRKFNLTELFADCYVVNCFRMEAIRGDGNHLIVGKVYRLSGMFYDSGRIRSHNIFVIADP